jgi:hypothetical protein
MKLKKNHFCLPEFYTADDESENYEEQYSENCFEHASAVGRSAILISDTLIGSNFLDDFERVSELRSIIRDLNQYINRKFELN